LGKIRIVFFGSGPVAAESLRLLCSNFDIEAVITKPSTAKEMLNACANSKQFSVNSKKDLDNLFETEKFESKVAVLIDFGIIVSCKVIDYFPFGIVNSHFSLLPEWRGADPITYSILSGQKQTGVSLMLLTEKMDEGQLLAQSDQQIIVGETTSSLTKKLIGRSYAMLVAILPDYLDGKYGPAEQMEASMVTADFPSYSRKLEKLDGLIDWAKPASVIEREIRAFQPWPKSRTRLGDLEVIITRSKVKSQESRVNIGQVIIEDKSLLFQCGSGLLEILELQPAGKKPMTVEAFLAGYKNRIQN
jgi:methionyl-tRNA formyltransferase